MMLVMVSVEMKTKAERRLRQLLSEGNIAQPDEVEYRSGSIAMFWHSVREAIVVDVDDRGEVGESRIGRWRAPKAQRRKADGPPADLTSLRRKRAIEQDVRALLDDHGLRQPDRVEYGDTCIRLLFEEERIALVVDLTDPPEGVEELDDRRTGPGEEAA